MLLPSNTYSYCDSHYEHYRFLIWETFVCTIAYLRYYEKYREIHSILTHTYFLQKEISPHKSIGPASILNFRCYCQTLEYYGANKNKFSFSADIAVKRVKEPLITKESFSEADVFICQMSFALKINEGRFYWFPASYVYLNYSSDIWARLMSKQYCLKILPLFNVQSINELKRIIQENPVDAEYRHAGDWNTVPRIPTKFGEYEIASLP